MRKSITICSYIIGSLQLFAQLQPYGLQDKVITTLTAEESDYNSAFSYSLDYIFAGTEEDGVFKAKANDKTPNWISLGLQNKPITALTVQHWGVGPADGLTLFAAVTPDYKQGDSTLIFKREAYLLTDSTWIIADSGIRKNNNTVSALNAYYYTGHTPPGNLLAGSNPGIYIGGWNNFWTEVYSTGNVAAIDVYPHWFGNLAWAAGNLGLGPAAFRSDDQGTTWKTIYIPYPLDGGSSSLCINTRFSDSVYFAVMGSVYLTPDGGKTFTEIFSDLNGSIKTIALDPLKPENIFAAGSIGGNSLFFISSNDGGKTWNTVFPNLLPIYIAEANSILVFNNMDDKNASHIFIGTAGTGVWRYNYPEVTNINEKKIFSDKFTLYQNYPNPFNPSTKIKFTITSNVKSEMSKVSLKVYDILGNEVATLVNEVKPAGTYEIEYDGSRLATGIYFYVLYETSQRVSKKMCLIK
jgi:hypothetical protein